MSLRSEKYRQTWQLISITSIHKYVSHDIASQSAIVKDNLMLQGILVRIRNKTTDNRSSV